MHRMNEKLESGTANPMSVWSLQQVEKAKDTCGFGPKEASLGSFEKTTGAIQAKPVKITRVQAATSPPHPTLCSSHVTNPSTRRPEMPNDPNEGSLF